MKCFLDHDRWQTWFCLMMTAIVAIGIVWCFSTGSDVAAKGKWNRIYVQQWAERGSDKNH